MPRTARKHLVQPGFPHHIVSRGNNRRRIFSYPFEYERFLYYLHDSLYRFDSPLHQLSLMPNHFHLIATPPDRDSLSNAMQSCLQRYAQARNLRKGASGRLFEERFWCEPIMTLDALRHCTLYNDSNAIQASIVDHPADHIWSTCGIHYGEPARSRIPLEMWTPSAWYASLGPQAPAIYRLDMLEYLDGRIPAFVFENVRWYEQQASLGYTRKILRPDGSSAR